MNGPTTEKERYPILDLLRGLALMGIALANFPEFALWTFLSADQQAALPTAAMDTTVRFWQYMLVDGKFYTIFSLLFGVGFSLILARHGRRLFLRRMLILLAIGTLHLMLLWSGDILMLYAVGGLLLAVVAGGRREVMSDRALLVLAVVLILLPVAIDALAARCNIDYAAPFYRLWWTVASAKGINEDNFATWLRDAQTYRDMFAFLQQGACERLWEFVEGHRLPKVVGLFIIGYLAGKHQLYTRLSELPLRRVFLWTLSWGLPASVLYAWSAVHGHPWGPACHALLYAVSVVPLAFAYVSGLCLVYLRRPSLAVFHWIAAPGRMALSCYIGQSVVGILLFYGLGLGLGTTFGLVYVELTALSVFLLQIVCCRLWLRYFRFGPLEWIWRMLTYGRYFPILKPKQTTPANGKK